MSKVRFFLPFAALGLLLGCATEEKATPAPVVVTPPPAPVVTAPPAVVVQQPAAPGTAVVAVAPRVGMGRIESISAVPSSAAAGGGSGMRRIGVKMDDGTMQFLDTSAPSLNIGDRIEVTAEGIIRR